MWKHDNADGCIVKITSVYTIVKWDGINGEWHYTKEQIKNLTVMDTDVECV